MTDTRLAAMQGVVEVARKTLEDAPNYSIEAARRTSLWQALRSLDALPAPTPGEAVEVYGVIKNDAGVIYIIDHSLEGGYAGHVIANVTARVPLPTVPSVTADVEVTP